MSADADILTGYSIFYNRRWSIFGGTSAAAPTWAALAVLADASVACSGKTVGFANPALYQAARTAYSTYFNDVTTGNNSFGGLTGFSAAGGYDMAAGLGSPKGAAVAAVLCGSTWTPPAPPPAPRPPPLPRPSGRHADPPGGAERPRRPGRPSPAPRHRQRRPGPHLPRDRPACRAVARRLHRADHRQPHPRRARPAPPSPSPTRRARPRRRPSPGTSPAGRRSPVGSASTPRAARRCR